MIKNSFLHYVGVLLKHAINFCLDIYLIQSPSKFKGDVDALQEKVIKTQSIDYALLISALSYTDISRFDRVFDIGSGKGRCCAYLGKMFPEKEILGIELNPLVANISVGNLNKKFNNVKIISGDILDSSNEHLFFQNSLYVLFNPFDADLFLEFLNKINANGTVVFINASDEHIKAVKNNNFKFRSIILNKWYFDIEGKNIIIVEFD